jgi:hypothetical protein
MLNKTCNCCNKNKPVEQFLSNSTDDQSVRYSVYCKACHDAGNIQYGYGWYAGGYTSPQDMKPGSIKVSWLP